jgi:hypothetical protein
MNRISKRSAVEAGEALLEAGRTQPVLHYDVELGLARHHDWLRSDAPVPDWASASVGPAANSFVSVVIKTIVSAVLVGALGVAGWYARGSEPPSAAGIKVSPPLAQRTLDVAPSVQDLSEAEGSMGPKPIPVPEHGLTTDQPVRRTARANAADKRTTRSSRAHKDLGSARAASAGVEPAVGHAETVYATAVRVEPAALATTGPSEDARVERASQRDVAVAAPEPKPIVAASRVRPEPGAEAPLPDDLVEMQQVASAEQLLERSPERALALVRKGDQRFARGYFQQERAYIAIMALIRLGRAGEAHARAVSFAKQFPALPYGARIRSALEALDAAPPSAARDATASCTAGEPHCK